MKTITSANSSFALAVANVFSAPQNLSGYAADDTFMAEAVESVEVVQGIDGELSGGFVHAPVKMGIVIMPDSDSGDLFDQWYQYMQQTSEVAIASGTIILPAISKGYSLVKGYLTSYVPLPEGKKTLQPRRFEITWKRVIGGPN